jgi:hypothetical protein
MLECRRTHAPGLEAHITENCEGWSIEIRDRGARDHREITESKARTLEWAKELADREVLRQGHTCNSSCEDWVEVHTP